MRTVGFEEIPQAHPDMLEEGHAFGNTVALVCAKEPGLWKSS
jgi:hypothetical protein